MKKGMCLAVVLLLAVTTLAMAQRPIQKNRGVTVMPQLSLGTSKAEFALGEPVEFVLQVTNAPMQFMNCFYTIERQAVNGSWAEFFRSAQNPIDQALMAANTSQSFTWGQTNTAGTLAADQGLWRIKFFVPGGLNAPLIVNFNLSGAAAEQSTEGGGAVTIKCMRNKLVLGETVTFRLENVSGVRADLEGCYYVIERRKNNNWLQWMVSPVNPFSFRGMNPGEVFKWDWHQNDGRGHRTERGDWRIVFYAPRLANMPIAHQFNIR
jgi:hypothetical protein